MTLGGHRDVTTSRSHLRIPLELTQVTWPRHLSLTAEDSHVCILLPLLIPVLPGRVSSGDTATLFLCLLLVHIGHAASFREMPAPSSCRKHHIPPCGLCRDPVPVSSDCSGGSETHTVSPRGGQTSCSKTSASGEAFLGCAEKGPLPLLARGRESILLA